MVTDDLLIRKNPGFGTSVIVAVGISYFGYIASFLASVLVARLLGPEGKGLYSLFMETSFGLFMFSSLGIGNGQIYQVAMNRRLNDHFIPNAILFSLTLGLGTAILYYMLGAVLHFRIVGLMKGPAVILGIFIVPVISMLTFQRQYLLVNRSYRLAKLNGALVSLVPLVFYILLYFLHWVSIVKLLVAYALGQVICLVGFQYAIMRSATKKASFSIPLARSAISFGIWQYFGDLGFFLIRRLDFFLVVLLLGKAGLGIYSVAVAMAEITSRLTHEIGTILFPEFASGQIVRGRAAPIMRKTVFLMGVIAVFLAIISRKLVLILFGREFSDAATALQILIVGTIALSIIDVTWNYVMATGKPKIGIPYFLAGALIDIILNLVLTPKYGVVGASIAATVSYIISALLFLRFFCIREKCPVYRAVIVDFADIKQLLGAVRKVPKMIFAK